MRYYENVRKTILKMNEVGRKRQIKRFLERRQYSPHSFSFKQKVAQYQKDFNRCLNDPTAYKKLRELSRQLEALEAL